MSTTARTLGRRPQQSRSSHGKGTVDTKHDDNNVQNNAAHHRENIDAAACDVHVLCVFAWVRSAQGLCVTTPKGT